jgi:ribonuclease P/MRP protein subunit POP5
MLKPTLRDRNRYIVFEILGEGRFDRRDVVNVIWSHLLRLYGEVGAAGASLWVMDYDMEGGRGIIKVNHGGVSMIRSAMALVKSIRGDRAVLNVTLVSGTLKKARQRL